MDNSFMEYKKELTDGISETYPINLRFLHHVNLSV